MSKKEESQRKLLLFLLVILIISLSAWLIYSLYGYSRNPSSTKTNNIVNKKTEEKKDKEEKKTEEKDELQELVDNLMFPFEEYADYAITNNSNNYFFTEESYTFDTISIEQKVSIAILLYREKVEDADTISTYQIKKQIKEYFGREISTSLPERIIMQHTGEIFLLEGENYVSQENFNALEGIADIIQQKIVNKELLNGELIISVNFVFVCYKPGSTYDVPEEIRSNIYTDFKKENTLMIDVDYEKEESIIDAILEGDRTYTYKYHFKKGIDNNYIFDRIELEKA